MCLIDCFTCHCIIFRIFSDHLEHHLRSLFTPPSYFKLTCGPYICITPQTTKVHTYPTNHPYLQDPQRCVPTCQAQRLGHNPQAGAINSFCIMLTPAPQSQSHIYQAQRELTKTDTDGGNDGAAKDTESCTAPCLLTLALIVIVPLFPSLLPCIGTTIKLTCRQDPTLQIGAHHEGRCLFIRCLPQCGRHLPIRCQSCPQSSQIHVLHP